MRILIVFLVACAHEPPVEPPLGRVDRPYTAIPQYLAHPAAEERTPIEQMQQMGQLLREIDTRAAAIEPDAPCQDELKASIDELREVVPPKPDVLIPVDRMREVVNEIPKSTPDQTRRRLWALTDLIRLRVNF